MFVSDFGTKSLMLSLLQNIVTTLGFGMVLFMAEIQQEARWIVSPTVEVLAALTDGGKPAPVRVFLVRYFFEKGSD